MVFVEENNCWIVSAAFVFGTSQTCHVWQRYHKHSFVYRNIERYEKRSVLTCFLHCWVDLQSKELHVSVTPVMKFVPQMELIAQVVNKRALLCVHCPNMNVYPEVHFKGTVHTSIRNTSLCLLLPVCPCLSLLDVFLILGWIVLANTFLTVPFIFNLEKHFNWWCLKRKKKSLSVWCFDV